MRISDWSSDVCSSDLPLTGTYRRLHDGDRHSDEETVRRMFAEQVEDSRDERIFPDFNLDDIDLASLRIYRQMLIDRKPSHPALDHQGVAFLRQIGGWRKDRGSGSEGLTLAGLLRSEEHTSELQSLMRISYAVFCL